MDVDCYWMGLGCMMGGRLGSCVCIHTTFTIDNLQLLVFHIWDSSVGAMVEFLSLRVTKTSKNLHNTR